MQYPTVVPFRDCRVGVKYSSPSTQLVHQVLKIYTKYKSSTHYLKKYLSTSSTFISSTSTHIKIFHY